MQHNIVVPAHIAPLTQYALSHGSRPLTFQWCNGTYLRARVFSIYETDNGLELDDSDYEEYVACLIMVDEVLDLPNPYFCLDPAVEEIRPGVTIELTPHNVPAQIRTDDGVVLWEIAKGT